MNEDIRSTDLAKEGIGEEGQALIAPKRIQSAFIGGALIGGASRQGRQGGLAVRDGGGVDVRLGHVGAGQQHTSHRTVAAVVAIGKSVPFCPLNSPTHKSQTSHTSHT